MASKSPFLLPTPKSSKPLPSRPLLIDTALPPFHPDPDQSYPKVKSQTPRNPQSLQRKAPSSPQSQSISIATTPLNSTAKSVKATSQQVVLMEIHKPKTGTSTPRSGSKPGTQRAVYSTLTQKKLVQPVRDLGSPRSIQNSVRNSPAILTKTQSTPVLKPQPKPLSSLVTQVQAPTAGKRLGLSQEQIRERSERIYREHLFQTFQALKFVRTLSPVDSAQLRAKRVFLEKRKGYANRKTMIFDLDETLVHCCDSNAQGSPDVILPITFPTGEVVNAGINIRPFVQEVLTEANRLFEVIVFTASHQCYADVVLDYLDPSHDLIHHRLYRDNCISMDGLFLKDLRVLANRRLQDLVIVDNAAYSFSYQLDNGIPIISWQDDPYDRELFNLIDYMKVLAAAEDVRGVNRATFHLNTFYEDYIEEFLGTGEEKRVKMTGRKA